MIAKIAGPKFLRRREGKLPRNEGPNGPLNFIGGNYYSPESGNALVKGRGSLLQAYQLKGTPLLGFPSGKC